MEMPGLDVKNAKIVVLKYKTDAERKRLEYIANQHNLKKVHIVVLPRKSDKILKEFLEIDPNLNIYNINLIETETPSEAYCSKLSVDTKKAEELLTHWGYKVGQNEMYITKVGQLKYTLGLEQAGNDCTEINMVISSYSEDAIKRITEDLDAKIKEFEKTYKIIKK